MGLTVGRTTLHTLREGCSYIQFEEKLLSHHLAGLNIGSMNNSVNFIEGFVENMEAVTDRRIREQIHAIDTVPCPKRLFPFAVDKVT